MKKARAATPGLPSQRQLRIGESIRHAIAELLARGDLYSKVLARRVVTVPEVQMSPDLKLATVYVMPLGGEGLKEVLEALDELKREIRLELARRVNLKFTPDVRFRADRSFDIGLKIDAVLNSEKVKRDLATSPAKADDDDATGV